jgi:hypothetical protein
MIKHHQGLFALCNDSYLLLHYVNQAWGFFKERREEERERVEELKSHFKDKRRLRIVDLLFNTVLCRQLRDFLRETKTMQTKGLKRWDQETRTLLKLPPLGWSNEEEFKRFAKKQLPPQIWKRLPSALRDDSLLHPDIPFSAWLPWLQALLEIRILFLLSQLSTSPQSLLSKLATIAEEPPNRDFTELVVVLYGKFVSMTEVIDVKEAMRTCGTKLQKRLDEIPFRLTTDLNLLPKWDKPEQETIPWGHAAQSLVEIKQMGLDRLKVCVFKERETGLCGNLFWDESKNKVRKYCDEQECRKARLRARVSAFRKGGKTWQEKTERIGAS